MLDEQQIQILPEFIANQIAAGEVVQRPESVVKELVENSIDANATDIAVLIRQSGKQLIHIVDNGSGMSKPDVLVALKRHATSKIKSADDLHKIQTLGFRGEALASIASVANVEIRTTQQGAQHGWKLLAEPLKPEVLEPVQQEQGTQIFIRNLFYNIPARKKFLRSDITEFRHISDTMMKFALSHPTLHFTFHDGDSLIFDVKPDSLQNRIQQLFGDEVARSLVSVDYQDETVKIIGYVGKPNIARTTRASQFLFMNHRPIASKSLAHAIYQSYEHLIDKSQHPFFVLNIILDPTKVDVNVHPQKTEVKFEDERGMYASMQNAVMMALRSESLIPDIRFREQTATNPFEKLQYGKSDAQDVMMVNTLTGEIIDRKPSQNQVFTGSSHSGGGGMSYPKVQSQGLSPNTQQFDKTTAWNPSQMSAFDALFSQTEQPVQEQTQAQNVPERLIWQMHNKYIFIQTEDGLLIVDQHIAHERILYEKALRAMNEQYPYSQKLLFPVGIDVTPTEMVLYKELKDDLLQLGYTTSETSPAHIDITGVPLDIHAGEEASSLHEILEQYAEYQTVRPAESRDNLAASFGCRAAIKAGHKLNVPEMNVLMDDLFKCTTPEVCPHGRPVMIKFELKEFDRRFGRTS
ncbi:MAG: DNA mismatch repair endonuclease MutL [Candidatus Kapabacteria bacterium]|nr:DNA mismatch repair endonuclease MutL [Candidatus Kapabacteria bacterium]